MASSNLRGLCVTVYADSHLVWRRGSKYFKFLWRHFWTAPLEFWDVIFGEPSIGLTVSELAHLLVFLLQLLADLVRGNAPWQRLGHLTQGPSGRIFSAAKIVTLKWWPSRFVHNNQVSILPTLFAAIFSHITFSRDLLCPIVCRLR